VASDKWMSGDESNLDREIKAEPVGPQESGDGVAGDVLDLESRHALGRDLEIDELDPSSSATLGTDHGVGLTVGALPVAVDPVDPVDPVARTDQTGERVVDVPVEMIRMRESR
jgi:hypothetical protein